MDKDVRTFWRREAANALQALYSTYIVSLLGDGTTPTPQPNPADIQTPTKSDTASSTRAVSIGSHPGATSFLKEVGVRKRSVNKMLEQILEASKLAAEAAPTDSTKHQRLEPRGPDPAFEDKDKSEDSHDNISETNQPEWESWTPERHPDEWPDDPIPWDPWLHEKMTINGRNDQLIDDAPNPVLKYILSPISPAERVQLQHMASMYDENAPFGEGGRAIKSQSFKPPQSHGSESTTQSTYKLTKTGSAHNIQYPRHQCGEMSTPAGQSQTANAERQQS